MQIVEAQTPSMLLIFTDVSASSNQPVGRGLHSDAPEVCALQVRDAWPIANGSTVQILAEALLFEGVLK